MSARIKPVDPREFADEPPPRPGGRQPKLTPEQRAEVRRRYALHRAHHPSRIAADYGISRHTFDTIVSGHRYRDER